MKKPKSPKIKPFDRVMQRLTNLAPTTRKAIGNVVRACLARGLDIDRSVEEAQNALRQAALRGLPAFQAAEEFELLRSVIGDEVTNDLAQKLAAACVDFSRAEMDKFRQGIRYLAQADGDPEDIPTQIGELLQAIKSSRIATSPEVYTAVKRENPEDATLECYMECLSHLQALARRETDEVRRRESSMIWTMLRDARVFHVGAPVFGGLYQEADRYTTQEVAGLDFQPFNPIQERPIPEKESDQYVKSLRHAAKHIAYPDKFPFDFVFLGYGNGVVLPPWTMKMKAPTSVGEVVGGAVIGHLMTADGHIYGFIEAMLVDGREFFFIDALRTPSSGWPYSIDLEPWVLPNLINIINDHRTFVVESEINKPMRQAYKDAQRKLGLKNEPKGHIPPPYYTIKLQSHVLQEKLRSSYPSGKKGPKSYRSDVRGHERCRIMRGDMPIDPKLAEKLLARGYVLYTANQLDAETYRRLSERGLSYKRSDEWIAVKTSWVDDHQSPKNPDLPYLPAVRKFGNVRVRTRKASGKWTDDPASV